MITTKRFVLRDFRECDRAAFLRYQMDPRYLALYDLDHGYEAEAQKLFSTFLSWQRQAPRRNYQLGIFDCDSRLCGTVGLRKEDTGSEAVFGIELTPDDWGRFRLAVEVAAAMIEYGFQELGFERIVGNTASGNDRVRKLASWFGAEIVAERSGPQWMSSRNWNEVDWALSRSRWSAAGREDCRKSE